MRALATESKGIVERLIGVVIPSHVRALATARLEAVAGKAIVVIPSHVRALATRGRKRAE